MKTQKFTLINGTFDADESRKILMDVFASKIQFHEKKRLASLIKNQKEDDFSTERIRSLKAQVEELKTTLANLDPSTCFSIQCEIFLSVSNEP